MAKYNDIRMLAGQTAKGVSSSPRDWMKYLDTAAKLYRYSFPDTLLIHAQRPDATACASLEVWNKKMFRWVNRGAKGIALIDDTGPRRGLRYVFDVSDTHMVRGGRNPNLWRLQEKHQKPLLYHLMDVYGIEGDDAADLQAALLSIASLMAEENLDDAMEGITYELEGSFLEGLDEDTIRVEFLQLLINSTFYMLSRRCGLDPSEYVGEEDFRAITDFNRMSVLAFLGNAASSIAEPVLVDIGRTLRQISLEERNQQEIQKTVEKRTDVGYNEFSTLIRESNYDEGGKENGTGLPQEGRLPVSEPDIGGGRSDNREVRDAEKDIPEGTQEELVSEHAADREAEPSPDGDRGSGGRKDGDIDGSLAGETSRTGQGERPDGMDGAHEQPDSDGGGERLRGIGIQLNEETTELELSEAEEIEASALSLPDFPTAKEQIREIEERVAAIYAGEISIPPDVVDEVLRSGGNRNESHLRIIYNFMTEQTPEEYTEFVRREYGTGGIGLEIGGKEYSVWYDGLGMQIAVGHTVTDRILDKAFLSWEDVSGRIHQLLQQGEYAPQVVLDAARSNAVREHAQVLAYMEGDMEEGVAELVFEDLEPFRGGYPDKVEKISSLITQPGYLAELNERLEGLAQAYAEDPGIMRFHYYSPDKVATKFRNFAKEAVPYHARDGFAWQEHPVFITEDEIDEFLAGGGAYSDGRLSIYAFYLQEKPEKEWVDFIKSRYGIGGRSHALSGADNSHADYNGKGLTLARGSYGDPDTEILMKWPKVAKRIKSLIENDRYLKAADYSRMPVYEQERMAGRIINFYARMPDEIERPYGLNQDYLFDYGNAEKTLSGLLENPDSAQELLGKMDAALAALPLDFKDYGERAQILSEIHGYVEGTYTIFPKKDAEIPAVEDNRQLSIFDFLDAQAQEAEPEEAEPQKIEREPKLEKEPRPEKEPETEKGAEKDSSQEIIEGEISQGNKQEPEKIQIPEEDEGSKAEQTGEKNKPDNTLSTANAGIKRDKSGNMETIYVSPHITVDQLGRIEEFQVSYWHKFVFTDPSFERAKAVAWLLNEAEAERDTIELDRDMVRAVIVEALSRVDANKPLTQEAAEEYDVFREQYPDALIGFEQNGYYEFYGRDADRVSVILNTYIYDKQTENGPVRATGFPSKKWPDKAKELWENGEDVFLASEQADGTHLQIQYLQSKDYLPIGTHISIDGREFRIDTVDFSTGKVSMQDMTMAKEARYPIFREEPIGFVRSIYEKQEMDMPEGTENISYGEELTEQYIFEAMEQAGVSFGEFSPEQTDVVYEAAEKELNLLPLLNPEFPPEQMQLIADVLERIAANEQAEYGKEIRPLTDHVMNPDEINTARKERRLPLERGETDLQNDRESPEPPAGRQETGRQDGNPNAATQAGVEKHNFHITDDDLGAGGPKQKFQANMAAIRLLKELESENRLATPKEQETLSRYVGWGGIPVAFDEKNGSWTKEYEQLKEALTPEEYREARSSVLNAFYTSPTVIKAMYEALGNMGLKSGNVLEPSCGVGNFMGLVPEEMDGIHMYGVELDSISGRIAGQLYQKNQIRVQGFETAEYPDSFFDCVIGNVPFGNYQVVDKRYDRYHLMIHDYFIAKAIDLVRPGGVVAVVTSSGTMDKQNPAVRQYLANRADLLGAVRLPNNAFRRNAGTDVVSDILFLQKRDRAVLEQPPWVELGQTAEGYTVNSYFAEHPEMVLGEFTTESTQYGKQEVTVKPIEGADLAQQLKEAVSRIHGEIGEAELDDFDLDEPEASIPADPAVKNFSFANVDGKVYYRENSRMNLMELPATTTERVLGMIALRNLTQELIQCQLEEGTDAEIALLQSKLNQEYDSFTARYGLICSTANRRAFSQDSSYCLLASLEILDEEGNLNRKADIFNKRTIRRAVPVTSVDTASEALAVSIGEKARVDLPYMAQLSGKTEDEITEELAGVIFQNPLTDRWETSDEYLSGNVREKLAVARQFAENHPEYETNVQFLNKVQPKDLEASEIEVRLGATWIDPKYITEFMGETFHTPRYFLGSRIDVKYATVNGQWNISGKTADSYGNALVTSTYGTGRANAYRLLEDALNLRDTKIYDTIEEDGKEKRVLNKKETMLAQQKQDMIKEAFKEWIFRDIDRREELCRKYNDLFNSVRPREYDGRHIQFVGMTPEITLMPHQKNAVAHILYGNNTLLAHCVGAGKTFQMIAAGMEGKRLGLAQKNLYVVPNHLTEQWGSDFLRLYPGANVLVATKKDFEPANRKKFCSRIATGEYDAIIIGHSQFERIPLSKERQAAMIEKQINDITFAIEEAEGDDSPRYTIKQMEKTRKGLQARLDRLNDQSRKDDVVTFEQLGVDRLFVDESHFYKNLFLYTKMRNVAGISQTDAQKSSDMFMKCQYLDEITGGRGVTFATGTPVSNSMVELYTIMRYLQYDTLQRMGMGHFDSWAASFGETVTAVELSPEGTGYRAKTRFARFFNLPELISLFKESADVQTADMLELPVPEAEYINEVLKPSEEQKEMVSAFAERAQIVRNGGVDPTVDNMLKITNDGRKCALDQRLLNDMLPDAPESKVNRCIQNAFKIWKETVEDKSTQLIFCDLSTPKNDGNFNVYDDVREKLVEKGIPREEIAFIHEAGTETKKAELFAKVRSGQVRILLGSTPKLGAGTNIQDRLIALHHLDCPWKPADLEQQEGRILRQGNRNQKVKIFRYVTENTFDSYMWQILENKQKFISQIMTSKSPVRACEDVDDTALSYAEIKALATGNPYIREKMDLDIQVSKLKLLKANHTSQKYRLESDIAKNFPIQIAAQKERIAGLKSDAEAVKPVLDKEKEKEDFSMLIGGKTYTDRKEAGTALIAACAGLKAVRTSGKIGEFHGFSMSASYDTFYNYYTLTLQRQCSYKIEVGKDALGNLQRISNALSGIGKQLLEAEQKLENLQEQLATAQEEVAKPFAKEAELAEKTERLAELNALLNMDEKGPSEAIGIEEAAEKPRGAVTMAEKVSEESRIADGFRKPSVLGKLRQAQERIADQANRGKKPMRKAEQAL